MITIAEPMASKARIIARTFGMIRLNRFITGEVQAVTSIAKKSANTTGKMVLNTKPITTTPATRTSRRHVTPERNFSVPGMPSSESMRKL